MSSKKLVGLTIFGSVMVGRFGDSIAIHPTLSGSLMSPAGARQLATHLNGMANAMPEWDKQVFHEDDIPKKKKGKIRVKRRKNK